MSDRFDENQHEETAAPARPQSRSRALLITGLVLVLAFFALTTFSSIYTDRLWYRAEGYGEVFSKLFWTRTGLFVLFGLLMAVAVGANMYLAHRFRPFFRPDSPEQAGLERYRDAVLPVRGWLLAGVSTVIGLFAGTAAAGEWRTYLLWANRTDFDRSDRFFGQDIGFYVFELPWLHYLVNFAMAALVIALLAAATVHYLYGGIRLQTPGDRLTGAAQVQFSVLLGLFVLAKAADYWLDRYDLVSASGNADRRHHLHRRPRGAAGQEHPAWHLGDLRHLVLPQHLAPDVDAAVGGARPARLVGRPARDDLARHRAGLPGPADRAGQGTPLHRQQHRLDPRGLRHPGRRPHGVHRHRRGLRRPGDRARRHRVGAAGRPPAGAPGLRADPAGPLLLLGLRRARRRPLRHRRHRPGAGAGSARARPAGSARRRPQLVQPPHRLHPRQRHHRGVRQPTAGQRRRRGHRDPVGRGPAGEPERAVRGHRRLREPGLLRRAEPRLLHRRQGRGCR